jgi:tetratricopeptide (TPR) repeat protein
MSSPASPTSSWPRLAAALLLMLGACVDHAGEHRVRANAFLRGGDAAAALKECDDGLAQSKGDLALLILRGNALFELERLDEARDAYQAALDAGRSKEPRALTDAHRGLAMVASRQKDWGTARRQFETLIDINDKDASSHLNVARACLELEDFACAVHHAEEAGRRRGDEEPVLYTLGTIYLAAGKPEDARLTFQHICDVIPGAASCPYGLALVAARAGDSRKAIDELDDAVRRKLPNPDRIAIDPGFASLRDDPEFKKIVARATHP